MYKSKSNHWATVIFCVILLHIRKIGVKCSNKVRQKTPLHLPGFLPASVKRSVRPLWGVFTHVVLDSVPSARSSVCPSRDKICRNTFNISEERSRVSAAALVKGEDRFPEQFLYVCFKVIICELTLRSPRGSPSIRFTL